MKIKFLRTVFVIFIGLISFSLSAQDASFSQFYANSLYYNPGLTGLNSGSYVGSTYRNQWANLPGVFNTYNFMADTDLGAYRGLGGLGIVFSQNNEGENFLKTTTIGISLASRIPLGEKWAVSAGIRVDMIQKSVDYSNMVFSDQLDPVNGNIYPTAFHSIYDQKFIFPDLVAGAVLKYESAPGGRNYQRNYIFKIGYAAHHLTQPEESFTGSSTDSRLPIKHVFHTTVSIPTSDRDQMIISPGLLYEKQSELETFQVGVNAFWKVPFLGLWYRSENLGQGFRDSDSFILMVGAFFDVDSKQRVKAQLAYSYDATISGLKDGTGGSHEINLNIYLGNSLFSRSGAGRNAYKRQKITAPIF